MSDKLFGDICYRIVITFWDFLEMIVIQLLYGAIDKWGEVADHTFPQMSII
jgi:hypothetical protein